MKNDKMLIKVTHIQKGLLKIRSSSSKPGVECLERGRERFQ